MNDTAEPTPPITVAVFRDGAPLFTLDAAGCAFAADDPEDRTAAAALLARAAGALAEMPPAEPSLTETGIHRLLDALEEIGTPEAETAHAALCDARENLTAALDLTSGALRAAIPTEH